MKKSRREFMKIAGISAAALAGAFTAPGAASAAVLEEERDNYSEPTKGLQAKRWGMAIFTDRFKSHADFQKVIDACHKQHNVPNIPDKQNVKWIWSANYHETFTEGVNAYNAKAQEERDYLLLCNHCENPACVRVCPTGATFKRKDGIVVMDYHRCIGCRFCMAGCPYGARSFNFKNPRPYLEEVNPKFPTRMRGVVEKCTFCASRLAEGLLPYCVEASNGAIVFGDLTNPRSDVSKALKENYSVVRKPSLGTGPSVYYII